MLQLNNKTPFGAGLALLPDEQGADTLYVALKATFLIGKRLTVAAEQDPLKPADEYWGEPGASSLKYAAEIHLCKRATDVAMIGSAHAPGMRPVPQVDVSLTLGPYKKTVRVFGDRTWSGSLLPPAITPAKPFETMPLTYERSFGGVHVIDEAGGEVLCEARNPVGCGFTGKKKRGDLAGASLPNLENPAHLISKPGDAAVPACFGFVAPSWEPRKSFAGTYDEAWQEGRAPFLPHDFDPRFFNAAHPDLVTNGFLQGGEPVEILNASPGGAIRFTLPALHLEGRAFLNTGEQRLDLNLETVLIEPDETRLSMTWRGAVGCDKKGLKVREVVLQIPESQLREYLN